MVVSTRKRSKDTDAEITSSTAKLPIDQRRSDAQRPDLTRIQTDFTPQPRRDSNHPDNLHYSASTTVSIPRASEPAMSQFTLLSQTEEDDLHAKRLLNYEEKAYKRIQKRLLAPSNPIQEYLRRKAMDAPPPPPVKSEKEKPAEPKAEPEPEEEPPAEPRTEEEVNAYLKSLETFTHAALHDFSSLTTSLARLQFLLTSNAKERDRYYHQSNNIQIQHVSIRDETAYLRTRLSEAKEQLEVRKGWDKHAEKVLWVDGKVGGEKAKTREELSRESDKLRAEIEELEREGDEVLQQWNDRRQGLADVKSEAMRLRRVIRGEPEPEHRDEDEDGRSVTTGHDAEENEEEQKRREGSQHPGGQSNVGTPRPFDDGAGTPLPVSQVVGSGGMTPRSNVEAGAGDEVGVAEAAASTPGPDAEMADVSEQAATTTIPEVRIDEPETVEVDPGENDEPMETT